jgi:phosphonopyruvate decarboxylase|tara:strand:+ start:2870 stop:4003 length:1134 start_codon:yes stop_codon:yes gene_type:complete
MVSPNFFTKSLKKAGYEFVTGVPDSLLKDLCEKIENVYRKKHLIATNEGSAVALAIGHYLGKKKPAVIYLQNSGLGNTINPITSLADPKVYGIPMLLIIGWRGETGRNKITDEPQHKKQGLITLNQLKILSIPYKIIDSKTKQISKIIKELKNKSIKYQCPVAIVVRKNTFLKNKIKEKTAHRFNFKREEAIKEIIKATKNSKNIVVSTTGMASRELYEYRLKNNENIYKDFLTVGGMGHASQIAAGIAMTIKKKIICIDGDGSMLMHTGSLGINSKINNLIHIVINNSSHDSVGGQPTLGESLDLKNISKFFGYKNTFQIKKKKNISYIVKKCLKFKKSSMIIINCDKGHRKNLGRPENDMKLRKMKFLNFIKKNK